MSWKYTFIFLFLVLSLFVLAVFQAGDDKLHFVMCDVKQGDAILIYRKQTQILVDGGPDSKVLSCLSRHMPFWDRKIELVILTNPDSDHYSGLVDVLRRYDIDLFTSPGIVKPDSSFEQLQNELKLHKTKTRVTTTGGEIRLGLIKLHSYWPSKEYLAEYPTYTGDVSQKVLGASTSESVNKWSLVFELTYGSFKALLTGDIVPPAIDYLATEIDHRIDVLKVPHHGSKNGLTESLLQAGRPKLALVSDGKNNRYGHPNKETLDLLEHWNVRTLRTDLVGEIEVTTDGKTWSVNH